MKIKIIKNQFFTLLFTAASVITLGWLGDLLMNGYGAVGVWLLHLLGFKNLWLQLAISALLFFLFSTLAIHYGRHFMPLQYLKQDAPHSKKVLVYPVSVWADNQQLIPKLQNKNLAEDLAIFKDSGGRWNGEILLLALNAHQKTLNKIYFIGSKSIGNTKGSIECKAEYDKLVRHYFHEDKVQIEWMKECDFENTDELNDLFELCINNSIKSGIAERDIILDCTGGQKTTSIAAAMTTLRYDDIEFQYVSTNTKNVISYNVISASAKNS